MGVCVRSGVCGRFINSWISVAFQAASPAKRVPEKKGWLVAVTCSSSSHREPDQHHQLSLQDDGIMCDLCNGSGWLICDFCRGQKTNVKSASSRFYRRCPSCKAVGLTLCPKCKVFKCVIFPDFSDSLP